MIIRPMSLKEAIELTKGRLHSGVVSNCLCCGQTVKLYPRQVNKSMAMALIKMYLVGRQEYLHLPTLVGRRGAEEAKMAHWGLIEELKEKRDDGGRAGYWRVTDVGVEFLRGAKINKYAMLYNRKLYGFDGSLVSIEDCLQHPFRLDELLGK